MLHVHCDGEGCTTTAPLPALVTSGPMMMESLPLGWRSIRWTEKPGESETDLEARRAAQIRARLGAMEDMVEVPHHNMRRALLCPACGDKVPAKSEVVGMIPQLPPGVSGVLPSLVD